MGLFKSIKKAVSSVVKTVTKVVEKAAPIVAPIVGAAVGGPAGAAIGGAIGGVASGGGVKGAIIGAGLSYAGSNLLTSASNVLGGQIFTQSVDTVGKIANVFQVVKAVNSTTGENRYIGVGDIVPTGFTVDTTQAPLTVSSPNYENNLNAAKPLNAADVQAAAMQAAKVNNVSQPGNNNQLIMIAAIGGLAYLALRGKK